jgi:uncharacterized protein
MAETRCPICGKTSQEKYRPFCNARCADIDLGRWLTEGYATSGGPDDAPPSEEDE